MGPDSSGIPRREAVIPAASWSPGMETARTSPVDLGFGRVTSGARGLRSLKPGEPHDRQQGATNLHRTRGESRRSREKRQGRNGTRELAAPGRRRRSNPSPGVDARRGRRWRGIFESTMNGVQHGSPQTPGKGSAPEAPGACTTGRRARCAVELDDVSGSTSIREKDTRGQSPGTKEPGPRPLVESAKISPLETGGQGQGGPRERPTTRNQGTEIPEVPPDRWAGASAT